MPYIKQTARKNAEKSPLTVGELNFAITQMLMRYVEQSGESYTTFNALVGVLECAKLELYRRMVSPYEDDKCAENGDVYPLVSQ